MPPLPRRVEHHADEPAYSLLIRTLEHNGCRKLNAALDHIGGAKGKVVLNFDAANLAIICKADPDAVAHATPLACRAGFEVMGQTVSTEQVSTVRRRWCPRCLSEQSYHRAWWDITPVTMLSAELP